jgi:hypothetical protein
MRIGRLSFVGGLAWPMWMLGMTLLRLISDAIGASNGTYSSLSEL